MKNVVINFDLSKVSGSHSILVVVQKNCETELSSILAAIFNICLKESCFLDCWKVWSVVPVFKNVGERSTTENYHPASLLSAVDTFFENLQIIGLLIASRNKAFFLISKNGFWFSWSAAEFLTVAADIIARVLNRPWAVRAITLQIGYLAMSHPSSLCFVVVLYGVFWRKRGWAFPNFEPLKNS